MKKKKCVMMSFDVSSTCTGYAKYINGKLVSHGVFDFSKRKMDPDIRLESMKRIIVDSLVMGNPQIVVVEESASNNNIKVQRMLSELMGVIEGFCMLNDAEFVVYRPNEWRNLVKKEDTSIPRGRNKSKKWDVVRVNELFEDIEVVSDDEADAILIGLARINYFDRLLLN